MTEKRDPVDEIAEDDLEPEAIESEAPDHREPDLAETTADANLEAALVEAELILESEIQHPADLHALAALALGIAPAGGDPDIRPLVASSPALQRELKTLLPVAEILTSLYQAQPAAVRVVAPVPPTPADSERGQPATTARSAQVGAATGAARAAAMGRTVARPRTPGGLSGTTAAIVALAVVAVLAVLWALALLDRLSTKGDEIAALREQIAELRGSGGASAVVLTPTSDEASDARGTIFVSAADGSVLLDVSGLPELEDEAVYQVWFQSAGSDEWVLGPAFGVNSQGESVQRLPGDAPGFDRVAISRESARGSPEPSDPFLLEGSLTDEAG